MTTATKVGSPSGAESAGASRGGTPLHRLSTDDGQRYERLPPRVRCFPEYVDGLWAKGRAMENLQLAIGGIDCLHAFRDGTLQVLEEEAL